MDAVSSEVETVSALMQKEGPAAALEFCTEHLAASSTLEGFLRDTSEALVATVTGEGLPSDLREEKLQDLLQTLILEPSGETTSPALHACIAARHLAGAERVLPQMAAFLLPALEDLWRAGNRERSFLLMLLLLRSQLAGTLIDEAKLRQWHHDALPGFTRGDFEIPYNGLFDRLSFQSNVADIQALLITLPAEKLVQSFAPWQIVQLHWITGGSIIDTFLPTVSSLMGEDTSPGARSLALRTAALGRGPIPAGWETTAASWARIQQGRSPGTATAQSRLESRPFQALHAGLGFAAGKAPFLRLGRRRPRIAVCVSGQLRGWREALPTWRAGLLQGADARFFVHTWKHTGQAGVEANRAYLPFAGTAFCAAWRDHAVYVGTEDMTARYPSLMSALRKGGEVTAAEISEFYGTDHVVLEDDSAPQFDGWSNSQKMHYKLAASHDLAVQSGGDFDLILRIRPDKETGFAAFSWSDLISAARAPAIFADTPFGYHYGNPMIGDQLAIGTPEAMSVYASTIHVIPQLQQDAFYRSEAGFHGHKSLAFTLWHAGIALHRLPVKMGRLIENTLMGSREILQCIARDATGRNDAVDQALIAGAQRDVMNLN